MTAQEGRSSTVTDLVGRKFRQGDARTVREVHLRVRRIIGYRGYGVPREEQRDLEQEVMTQLWQAVQDSRVEVGSRFWGFVETVTARRLIDWLRVRRETTPVLPEATDEPDPLGTALERERATMASALLRRLPSPCRRLIHLRLVEGRSYAEISRILHKSEGSLRVQMHRCVAQARDVLEQLRGADDDWAHSMRTER